MADLLKYAEVKDWDEKTIDAKVNELRIALFKGRMQKSTAGIDKPHSLKVMKKNIARLLTAKNAKNRKS